MKKISSYIKLLLLIVYILFFYFFYWQKISLHVFGADSADFATSMSVWGIAHPPGYPFYNLLGNLVRQLPFENVYFALSLPSACFTLLSGICIYLIVDLITQNKIASLISSLFFLVLFPVWLYGLVPEAFALAGFLILLQIYSILCFFIKKSYKKKYVILLSLSVGLSVAHHHLFLFFIPSYYYLLKKEKSLAKLLIDKKYLVIFSFICGAIFYIYAPIVSFLKTPLDIENAKSLAGFVNLITRSSYGTFKAYAGSGGDFTNRLYSFFSFFIFLVQDFKPLGIIFLTFGLFFLFRKSRALFNFFVINLVFLLFFLFYSNFFLSGEFGVATYERFLIFIYLVLTIVLGLGINYFSLLCIETIKKTTRKGAILDFSRIIVYLLALVLLLSTVITNYKAISNVKNNKDFENFGLDILKTPEKNALLTLKTDNSYFLAEHFLIAKKIRPDLTLIPMILEREYIRERIIGKNPKIYFPKINSYNYLEEFHKRNYEKGNYIYSDRPSSFGLWIPYGILWKYYPSEKEYSKNSSSLLDINNRLWLKYRIPASNYYKKSILFTEDILQHYLRQIWSYANFLIVSNQTDKAKEIVEKYYKRFNSDYYFLLTYVNLKVYYRECQNLKADLVKLKSMNIKHSVDYLPILNYYKTCERNPQEEKKIKKLYDNLQKKEEGSIEKI